MSIGRPIRTVSFLTLKAAQRWLRSLSGQGRNWLWRGAGMAGILLPGSSWAESGPELERMWVTSPRLALGEQLGLSQVTISRAAIEAAQSPRLIELLAQIPGLHLVQTGARGSDTSLSMRGSKNSQFILAIDGIPQRDATLIEGGALLAHLGTVDVERVEIYKGPQSLAFGSDGLAGLINIVTRRHTGGQLSLGAGNLGYQQASFYGRQALSSAWQWGVAAEALREEGESDARGPGPEEADPYAARSLSAQLGYEAGPWHGSLLLKRKAHTKALDSFASDGFGDDPNYEASGEEDSAALFMQRDFQAFVLDLTLNEQRGERIYENEADARLPSRSRSAFIGSQSGLDLKVLWTWHEDHRSQAGVQFNREQARFEDDYDGALSEIKKQQAHQGAYLSHSWQLHPAYVLKAGARRDEGDERPSSNTYNVHGAYESPALSIYTNLGRAFKAPSLYQRFSAYGNSQLKAEQSEGWELGAKVKPSIWLTSELSLFQNRYENLIDYEPATQSFSNKRGETRIRGIEGQAAILVAAHQLIAQTTQLDFRTADGSTLPRRARQTHGLLYQYETPRWLLGGGVQRVGDREDAGQRLPPYETVQARGEWRWRSASLYIRGDNLLAKRYEPAVGYGGDAPRYAGGMKWQF